jgi:hypothetical protein
VKQGVEFNQRINQLQSIANDVSPYVITSEVTPDVSVNTRFEISVYQVTAINIELQGTDSTCMYVCMYVWPVKLCICTN